GRGGASGVGLVRGGAVARGGGGVGFGEVRQRLFEIGARVGDAGGAREQHPRVAARAGGHRLARLHQRGGRVTDGEQHRGARQQIGRRLRVLRLRAAARSIVRVGR